MRFNRLNSCLATLALAAVMGCQQQPEFGKVANLATASKIRRSLVGEGAAAGEAEAAATGTGWATLKGRFIFEGNRACA
jgi:hypothetical protein